LPEEEHDEETVGKEIWRGKCGQRASSSARGLQHKIEQDGGKCTTKSNKAYISQATN